MSFKYSIIETRSTDTIMRGTMQDARAPLCHIDWLGDSQLNPPRGRNTGGASSLSLGIEPNGLPLRKRDLTSRPELCVGRRTAHGKRDSM